MIEINPWTVEQVSYPSVAVGRDTAAAVIFLRDLIVVVTETRYSLVSIATNSMSHILRIYLRLIQRGQRRLSSFPS